MTIAARRLTGLLLLAATASAGAHDFPDFPGKDEGGSRLFTVPIEVSLSGFTTSTDIQGKVTLKKPAILESYFGFCAGIAKGGTLAFDGGPKGVNGTLVEPLNTHSGAQLNMPPQFGSVALEFKPAPAGVFYDTLLSPAHIGVPVKSELDIQVFTDAGGARCDLVLTFRALD